MTRVAILSHVKESTIPPAPSAMRVGPRIAWGGGKIVSNKDEALRKFYERKLRKGESLTPDQLKALESMVENIDTSKITSHNDASKKQQNKHTTPKNIAHRAHVKVQSNSHTFQHKKALVVNGRVVGPRVKDNNKANASRGAKAAKKSPGPQAKKTRTIESSSSSGLALQDKLSMSLDALVKRGGQ